MLCNFQFLTLQPAFTLILQLGLGSAPAFTSPPDWPPQLSTTDLSRQFSHLVGKIQSGAEGGKKCGEHSNNGATQPTFSVLCSTGLHPRHSNPAITRRIIINN